MCCSPIETGALAAGGPTCGGLDLGDHDPIANHGEHVTRHYVFGGGDNEAGGHFLAGDPTGPIAPGASFCVSQSQVASWHIGDE